jgi:hypothetical protein
MPFRELTQKTGFLRDPEQVAERSISYLAAKLPA